MISIPVQPTPQDNSYTVDFIDNLLDQKCKNTSNEWKCLCSAQKKKVIITDNNIKKLYGKKILSKLTKTHQNVSLLAFKAGEKSKNWHTAYRLARKMLKLGFDRQSIIIALGGGVVGDMSGFVANIFMRGIPFIQIPTTLLAMVDSSIGGKTGVDTPEGKNLLGTFYQPRKVLIDISFLKGLPHAEFLSGLMEVIKYGVIWDKKFFEYLENNKDSILQKDPKTLTHIIKRSIEIKAKIIAKDEKESHLRQILNFGHTYGHAIETLSNFKLKHGIAIGIGMHFASLLGEKRGFTETNRLIKLIKSFGVKVYPPKLFSENKIISKMLSDKKTINGQIKIVIPSRIGKVKIEIITEKEIREMIKNFK